MNERDVNGNKINKLLFGPDESKTHRRIDINYCGQQEIIGFHIQKRETRLLGDIGIRIGRRT